MKLIKIFLYFFLGLTPLFSSHFSFADTNSQISAYLSDIETGNLKSAEAKIRIALETANKDFGIYSPKSLAISFDLADVLLLQNMAQESLDTIEKVQAALIAKPELLKTADTRSINLINGLALSSVAKNSEEENRAADLLKKALKSLETQERSDVYFLNAYLFLNEFSRERKDLSAQSLYADKALNEAERLFGETKTNPFMSRALYAKSVAVFQSNYALFGYDGKNPKTGFRMGINSGRDFADFSYLIDALINSHNAMKYYGEPKSIDDGQFYKLLAWQGALVSYYGTVKTNGFKIMNENTINSIIEQNIELRNKLDNQGNYECRKSFRSFTKGIGVGDMHDRYGFGSMVARIAFDKNNEIRKFDVLASTIPDKAVDYIITDLKAKKNFTISSTMPSYCEKGFVFDLRFAVHGFE